MAVNDIAQIQLPYSNIGQGGQMAWAFRSLTGSSDWRQHLVDEFSDLCASLITAVMSVDEQIFDPECVDLIPGTGATVVGSLTHGADGVLDERPLPPQVAAVISWSAGGIGRFQRGRTYVGGLGRSMVNEDQIFISSDCRLGLETFAFQVMDVYGPSGTSPWAEIGVLSRQEAGVVRPVPLLFAYQVVVVRQSIGTQRRRVHRSPF